ncbi:MAG TPA: hypothetical protein VMF65_23005, partial [Acidimicrobiales bacterium]|nr:hypothetical protein [Acidimicrobiales bacterium]
MRHNHVVTFSIKGPEAQTGTNGADGRRADQPPSVGSPEGDGVAAPSVHDRGSRGAASSWLLNRAPLTVATALVILALVAMVPLAVHRATAVKRPVAALSGGSTTPDSSAGANANGPLPHRSRAAVPPNLQLAIDKTLSSRPVSSPAGISLSWGHAGAVSFRAKYGGPSFGLQPLSIERTHTEALTPGPFVFGAPGVSETLGHGLSAWYKISRSGFEQGFTVA